MPRRTDSLGRRFLAGVSMVVEHRELKQRALSSAGWTLARIGSDQGFAFVVFVVLARLLSPREMGVFALALAISELGKLIASAGFPDAVIREPDLDDALADGIFWANLAFAVLVLCALLALATPIAAFFREAELVPIVSVLAALVPVSALGSIHTARTLKGFGHRAVAARSLASNLAGGVTAIALASTGHGAWSMVLQRVVVELVMVTLAWHAFPWIPGWHLPLSRLRAVWRFSLNVMVGQVLLMAMMRSQDLIIGRVLSISAVGIYRLGWRAIDLLIQLCVAPLATIALPTLARLHDNRQAFANAVMRFNAVIALVACPAMLGFGALAPRLVPLIFGIKWQAAGEVAQVLSLLALPYATSSLASSVFSARGASGLNARIACLQLMVAVPVVWLAAPYGAFAVAVAYVARGYLIWPLQVALMLRETGSGVRALVDEVALPIGASLAAAVTVLLEQRVDLEPVPSVALGIILFAATYAALLLLLGRAFVAAHWQALRLLRQRAPEADATLADNELRTDVPGAP